MRIGILSAELGEEDVHENKRLAREIRLMGHHAKVINYQRTVVATTKSRQVLMQPDRKGILRKVNVHAVIPRINEADSASINLATLALECLTSNGVYSTASPSAIRLTKDKIRSLLVINSVGVPAPRTAAITNPGTSDVDLDKVLKIVEPNANKRLIVKTNIGTHGKGVMSANNRAEARAIVEGFLTNNIPVLLQQFVEPTRKDHYEDVRLVVVDGRVISAMKRESTRKDEIRANLSLGGKGAPYKPSAEEIRLAELAARASGIYVCGVDLIPSGKKRYVIEINSSPGFLIEKVTGVNVARKIVRQAVINGSQQELPLQKLAARVTEPLRMPRADLTKLIKLVK